jgi:drug/metabolite transporter (DMT)-like permease
MSSLAPATASSPVAQAATAGSFVLLWSTGFIFSKLGLGYAEPFTFLLLRLGLAALLMLAITLLARAPWPRSWREAGHIAALGVMLHGLYLGGVFAAIGAGVPAGVAALIVCLQPLVTAAIVGPWLGERVGGRQWLGLALGFGGVVLVLLGKLGGGDGSLAGYGAAFLGLAGITVGTLYQKRHCRGMDRRSGLCIQYAAGALAVTAAALLSGESHRIEWTAGFVLAVSWLVIVLSAGSMSLFTWLLRRGEATRVASLFYLVPPLAAVESYFIFHETLSAAAVFGMALAVLGVALTVRR